MKDKNKDFKAYIAEEKDLKNLLVLESQSGSEDIWDATQFSSILRNKKIKIALVNHKEDPSAYLAFEVKRKEIIVWSITVKKSLRRLGIGTSLVQWLKNTTEENFSSVNLTCVTRESDLSSQVFFRSLGFICTKTLEDIFECPPENGFFFRFNFQPKYD